MQATTSLPGETPAKVAARGLSPATRTAKPKRWRARST
jgi:hypothetical protein